MCIYVFYVICFSVPSAMMVKSGSMVIHPMLIWDRIKMTWCTIGIGAAPWQWQQSDAQPYRQPSSQFYCKAIPTVSLTFLELKIIAHERINVILLSLFLSFFCSPCVKQNYRVYASILQSKRLLYYQSCSLSILKLHANTTSELEPQIHITISFWCAILCVLQA